MGCNIKHKNLANNIIASFMGKMVSRLIVMLLFSCSVMSDSLTPHGLQHARLPCPSPSPGICSNSCPLRQ